MATNERLAAEIPAGTGLNGHPEELSGVVLGKHRLFAGGPRNLSMTSSIDYGKIHGNHSGVGMHRRHNASLIAHRGTGKEAVFLFLLPSGLRQ
jgi:hypothetical protein